MKSTSQIIAIKKAEQWILNGLNSLLPQLSTSLPPLTLTQLDHIIGSKNQILLAAVENQKILGTLTLIHFALPTGYRARIEDLVVDQSARGLGIGQKLIQRALRLVQNRGGGVINLTSNPNRQAANRLYKKLGFIRLDTNVYYCAIAPDKTFSAPV